MPSKMFSSFLIYFKFECVTLIWLPVALICRCNWWSRCSHLVNHIPKLSICLQMSHLHTISTKNLVQTIHFDMICEPHMLHFLDSLCQFEVILVFCGPCLLVRPSAGDMHDKRSACPWTWHCNFCSWSTIMLRLAWFPFSWNRKGVPIPVTEKSSFCILLRRSSESSELK